jgi:GNAT superfamily N-acetyltransferase
LIHLGAWGESAEQPGPPLPGAYLDAFRAIQANPATAVMVADLGGEVVGTFQFAVLRGLSHLGRPVAQVESVHVAQSQRSKGIGEAMMIWAINEARRNGCYRLQLTSNKGRTDAHRFYRRLGFVASHEGMKLEL